MLNHNISIAIYNCITVCYGNTTVLNTYLYGNYNIQFPTSSLFMTVLNTYLYGNYNGDEDTERRYGTVLNTYLYGNYNYECENY